MTAPTPVPGPAPAPGVARAWALAGTALIVAGVAAVLALHAVTVDEIDPVRRTLSQYALTSWKPVFDAGVLAVTAGSAAVLAGLVRAGLAPPRGVVAALLAAWCACLVVVVAFEKIDWSVGPTPAGYVHRYASLLAFFCLPAAALMLGRGWRESHRPGLARATWWLGAASLAWLAPILLGFVLRPLTGVPWWRFVPLGLFERGLALTEVAALLVIGAWVSSRPPAPSRTAGAGSRRPWWR